MQVYELTTISDVAQLSLVPCLKINKVGALNLILLRERATLKAFPGYESAMAKAVV